MNRANALAYMRIAGYHGDRARFTRLLIENRVSREAADKAWTAGINAKQGGMKCACPDCNKPQPK